VKASSPPQSSHDRIYAVVRRIPRGTVATYGQVAELAGLGGQARLVGYAMSALQNGTGVPWHRVINAQGKVSPRSGDRSGAVTQRLLLESEGVRFTGGRVRLEKFRWRPKERRP
jgi:methylated-DNA-protein-cysteine methyltransferase-like protein